MSKELRVVIAELRQAAHDLTGVAEGLRSGLNGVDGSVSGVVGRSWAGGAATEYGDAWKKWDDGMESVVSGLSHLSQWMDGVATDYYRVDSGGA